MRVPNDQKLAEEVPELHMILGGHDHHYEMRTVSFSSNECCVPQCVVCLSVCLSVCLFVCLFVCLSRLVIGTCLGLHYDIVSFN